MAAKNLTLPLIVVVGPTASGKTSLAIEMAEQFNGEIICADSRTIYKGMDVGTAKPTKEEQAKVPHWGLDLVEPNERFTAADFKEYATRKIGEIRSRGHVPFLVGGTGLYVDAIIFDYQFGPIADNKQRSAYEAMTIDELHDYCKENNVSLPENDQNKRYVIRAIEQKSINSKRRNDPIENSIIVGITTERDALRTQIRNRVEQIFDDGVVNEATLLGKKYGWDAESMTGNSYQLAKLYLRNELSVVEFKEKNTTLDWRLAKRQLTWLRRNPYIHWGKLSELRNYLTERLASYV
ncbi:MAG: putative tRNA dimethylallyltransferase [Candidatus Saccharibacteria bacterium]|nr:putative tRNA dimethylallyltransferase [Candidatus Saccharibacteria bacterium]